METLALLAGLGWLFWGVAAFLFLVAIVSVENEKFFVTTPVVLIAIVALIWFSGATNVLQWAEAHVWEIITGIAIYLGLGVVYGGFRYWFFAHKMSDNLTEFCNRYGYDRTRMTQSTMATFIASQKLRNYPLRVADSKHNIMFWMIYWPFSAPWTMINEPVKRFFNFAYNRIAGLLQTLANQTSRDVAVVPDPKPEKPEGKGLTGGRQFLQE